MTQGATGFYILTNPGDIDLINSIAVRRTVWREVRRSRPSLQDKEILVRLSKDLRAAWSYGNLELAWARVRASTDRAYKGYFRELYAAYASSDVSLLKHLQDRLSRNIYQPEDVCKIYLPKPSGVLRPISLLSIEDQIVYQALSNVVAEHLAPHVRKRYNHEVFGHQYAGSAGPWFYRKWTNGYRAFNAASRAAFDGGFVWLASFDLTAFYDSIDHAVLRHMLHGIGLSYDFGHVLTALLSKWTATSTQIYHNHGIPQGPVSSGLIAEAVLKHFDENHKLRDTAKYLRYVDDIRIFARSEYELRAALVRLDHLSKDVGLFPQSGKIDIHKVVDIERELKSVSSPSTSSPSTLLASQRELRKEIGRLAPGTGGYLVKDPTRFKFLLASTTASVEVADRLWKVYERAPQYYVQLTAHLSKFDQLHERHARRLISEVEAQALYPSVRAEFVRAATGRLPSGVWRLARSRFKKLWNLRDQADVVLALWIFLHQHEHLTYNQSRYALRKASPPWLRAMLHIADPWRKLSPPVQAAALNCAIRDRNNDIAIAGAWQIISSGQAVDRPVADLNPLAKILLKEAGIVRRASARVCGIRLAIHEMTGHDVPVPWKKLFGKNYKRAEAQIVACKGYFKTSPSAWVNSMDAFNDWLLNALHEVDSSIGGYTLGKVGSVLEKNALKNSYPKVLMLCREIHRRRYESHLSHALQKKSRKPTRAIPYKWLKTGARYLAQATQELERKYCSP